MKKAINLTLVISLIVAVVFVVFEPQGIKGAETDDIIVTAEVTEEISITSPNDVTLTPSIPGATGSGGVASSGSATWTIKTTNATGFNMDIKASDDPAMQLSPGDHFFDYVPAAAGSPDFAWTTPGSAGSAEFGFTVEPATTADTDSLFFDDGADCNTGALNGADSCWLDLNGAADIDMIYRATATTAAGEAEKVKFRAELNGDATVRIYEEGNYKAYITVTATMN